MAPSPGTRLHVVKLYKSLIAMYSYLRALLEAFQDVIKLESNANDCLQEIITPDG